MKIHILYRPNSDHSRQVDEYVHEFKRRRNIDIQLVNIDGREGSNEAEAYDIVSYPAIVVTKDNGELVMHWQGDSLPLMDELAAYASM